MNKQTLSVLLLMMVLAAISWGYLLTSETQKKTLTINNQ